MRRRLLRTIPVLAVLGTLGFGSGPDGCFRACNSPSSLTDEERADRQREEGRPHERRPPDEQLRPPVEPQHEEGGGGP